MRLRMSVREAQFSLAKPLTLLAKLRSESKERPRKCNRDQRKISCAHVNISTWLLDSLFYRCPVYMLLSSHSEDLSASPAKFEHQERSV
jgi:hypothetical protein